MDSSVSSVALSSDRLVAAVKADDFNTLVAEINRDRALVNMADSNGVTALLMAARHARKEMIPFLIKEGADVNIAIEGWTPLHVASFKSHHDVVKELLESGASPNSMNTDGTPLHIAAGKGVVSIVELLLEHGASTDLTNELKQTPITIAATENHFDVVSVLLKAKADIMAADQDGRTILHWAARHNKPEILEAIIQAGLDPNRGDNGGWNAIHEAAQVGNVSIIESLVKVGCRINHQDSDGDTPLHVAAFNGHQEIVRTLLQFGAKPDAQANDLSIPLDAARDNNHTAVVDVLIDAMQSAGMEIPKPKPVKANGHSAAVAHVAPSEWNEQQRKRIKKEDGTLSPAQVSPSTIAARPSSGPGRGRNWRRGITNSRPEVKVDPVSLQQHKQQMQQHQHHAQHMQHPQQRPSPQHSQSPLGYPPKPAYVPAAHSKSPMGHPVQMAPVVTTPPPAPADPFRRILVSLQGKADAPVGIKIMNDATEEDCITSIRRALRIAKEVVDITLQDEEGDVIMLPKGLLAGGKYVVNTYE